MAAIGEGMRQRLSGRPVERYQAIGKLFQIPMVLLFCVLIALYSRDSLSLAHLATLPGAFLFAWCLFVLYFRKARVTGLVTTGPYRFTRHPMYLGLFVMSLVTWLPPSLDSLFFALYAAWLALLAAAGYWQERETLARFGRDAEDYYARTPRLPFLA